MAHLDDGHGDNVVINRVQDAIVSLPDAIPFVGGELFCTGRSWILGQTIDSFQDALDVLFGNRAKILGNRLLEDYFIVWFII